MEKGSFITVEITDFTSEGNGVGKADGLAVFVKDAVIGDVVTVTLTKIKKNYAIGEIVKIIEPSPDRIDAGCGSFGRCGGCNFLGITYDSELAYKRRKIEDALKRIGGFDIAVPDIMPSEPHLGYRNKVRYHVFEKDGDVQIGFYGAKSHDVAPGTGCLLADVKNGEIIEAVKKYIHEARLYRGGKNGVIDALTIRRSGYNGDVMVILDTAFKLPNMAALVYHLEQIEGIKSIVLNLTKGNGAPGKTFTVWGDDQIYEYVDGFEIKVSPMSFFQVNTFMASQLFGKAIEFANLTGKETVIDAYCGAGTISLMLAREAKEVIGIEAVAASVKDATENAEKNFVTNARFIEGDASRVLEALHGEGVKPDVVVLDPPRDGCDKWVLKWLLELAPKRIVYVSCDPATLARDLKVIADTGYEIENVCGVDMFPRTANIETVVGIVRR